MEQGSDGSSQVFVQRLLGCYSRAPTLKLALRKTPSKITDYLMWLESYGEPVSRGHIRLRLCEKIKGDWPVNMGDSVAPFQCDKEQLDKEEIERFLRWMDYSWQDFQKLIRQVPKTALDWKPTPNTIRSIRRIIIHTALVQAWYLMKLRKKADTPFRYPHGSSLWTFTKRIDREGDISLETLNGLRSAVVYRLRNMSPSELQRITYHKPGEWTGRKKLEAWSARKVFRRFLWHEKLHMKTIRKILSAWDLHR